MEVSKRTYKDKYLYVFIPFLLPFQAIFPLAPFLVPLSFITLHRKIKYGMGKLKKSAKWLYSKRFEIIAICLWLIYFAVLVYLISIGVEFPETYCL